MRIKGPAQQSLYLSSAPTVPLSQRRQGIYYGTRGRSAQFEMQFEAQRAAVNDAVRRLFTSPNKTALQA